MTTPKAPVPNSSEEIANAQNFLVQFGYLYGRGGPYEALKPRSDSAGFVPGELDSETVHALELYQRRNKLPVSGTLDKSTARSMSRPRCGFPDIVLMPVDRETRPRWDHRDVVYSIDGHLPDALRIDSPAIASAVRDAFSWWNPHSGLEFEENSDGRHVDIGISLISGRNDPCHSGFSGARSRTFGHAFLPDDTRFAGQVHMNRDVRHWSTDPTSRYYHLTTAIAHEIGHALGLMHSDQQDALMHEVYRRSHGGLTEADICLVKELYRSHS